MREPPSHEASHPLVHRCAENVFDLLRAFPNSSGLLAIVRTRLAVRQRATAKLLGMSDVDPRAWAEEIARALSLGGERIPFQRVLRAHQHGLDALRARGLTWQSLAHLLLRAGVHRPDGRPYSADHLRVCADRLMRDPRCSRSPAAAVPRASARPPRRLPTAMRDLSRGALTLGAMRPGEPASIPAPSTHAAPASDDKDVSIDEIAAARARLTQIR
jgi:hypothetical protein